MKTTPIDPRTTRRLVTYERYQMNGALYAQYRVIGSVFDPVLQKQTHLRLEKKPEFCRH